MASPTQQHWTAAKRVLRYLSGTRTMGLTYTQSPLSARNVLMAWADTSYADARDSRSTGGCLVTLNGAAVSWQAFVLPQVALSTAEAEYYGLGVAAQDCMHLRELLSTLGLPQEGATVIYQDNQATIHLANNPLTNKKTRHMQVKHHFVRQLISDGTVYCPTGRMLADMLTKPLDPTLLDSLAKSAMNA